MFEKESVEYGRKKHEERMARWEEIQSDDVIEGFKDGAEFGYNKAKQDAVKMKSQFLELCNLKDMRIEELEKVNEWHYVKDELPRKSDPTLCELMPVFVAVKVGYKVSTYGTYWNLKLGKFECLDEVYAWCSTPEPPELPKESE